MRKSKMSTVRVLAVLALMFAIAAPAAAILSGRDLSRCMQACTATKTACADNCKVDCFILYSTKHERDLCVRACTLICADEMEQCKWICEYGEPPTLECP